MKIGNIYKVGLSRIKIEGLKGKEFEVKMWGPESSAKILTLTKKQIKPLIQIV